MTNLIPFIDLNAQQSRIKTEIDQRIQNVLAHGQYILGPEVSELEHKLSQYCGAKHSITVANGTDALMLALMALDIKPGDEVITSAFTFVANVEMMAILGIKAVFADIDPDTYNLDPNKTEALITTRTKAIMPVSLYGQCADLDSFNEIGRNKNIPIIEDAAQGFGGRIDNRKSCSMTAIACTSFFPSKPLGCYGDGGACFTNDDKIAEILKQIRAHGQQGRYNHIRIGTNSRLDTLQAAILIPKLAILEDEIQKRQSIAARYQQALNSIVKTPTVREGYLSAWAQYTIYTPKRDNLSKKLLAAGIPTTIHYPVPAHLQPAFKYLGYQAGSLPISEQAAKEVLSLPMHPYLDEATQEFIINNILAAIS